MIYLLDSNTCIAYLRRPLGTLAQKILSTPPDDLALSAVTVVELHRGAYLSAQATDNLAKVNVFVGRFTVLSLDTRAAEIAGRVDGELARQGSVLVHTTP
jgi:tRNA(fMet)-specific endonuclease VapC